MGLPDQLSPRVAAKSEQFSRELTGSVRAARLAPPTIGGLLSCLDLFGPVAVRSSALNEDTDLRSGAGRYCSVLAASTPATVISACKEVLASQFTVRALRDLKDTEPLVPGMALILQRMLAPEASGVLLTADPIGDEEGVTIIEASHGLGVPVVAGYGAQQRIVIGQGSHETVMDELEDGGPSLYYDRGRARMTARGGRQVPSRPVLSCSNAAELAAAAAAARHALAVIWTSSGPSSAGSCICCRRGR